jgi:hypothetical protein
VCSLFLDLTWGALSCGPKKAPRTLSSSLFSRFRSTFFATLRIMFSIELLSCVHKAIRISELGPEEKVLPAIPRGTTRKTQTRFNRVLNFTNSQGNIPNVIEAFIVVSVISVLIASGLAVIWLPWQLLLVIGFIGIGTGLFVGVPAGFYYHVLLRVFLLKTPPIPERWWIHPTRYHDRLKGPGATRVFLFFYLGAAGFFLIIVGAFITMLGVVRFW